MDKPLNMKHCGYNDTLFILDKMIWIIYLDLF
jgi:hypothetical protein